MQVHKKMGIKLKTSMYVCIYIPIHKVCFLTWLSARVPFTNSSPSVPAYKMDGAG